MNNNPHSHTTTDWLLRVGDGENFKASSRYRIYSPNSENSNVNSFLNRVSPGDRLWFVKNKSGGKLIAVATYDSHNTREFGPLLDVSMTNEELGWTGSGTNWISNVEVHYTNLYGLEECELLTHIKSPCTIRPYNEKCRVNLPLEYSNIVKYSKINQNRFFFC